MKCSNRLLHTAAGADSWVADGGGPRMFCKKCGCLVTTNDVVDFYI